MSGLAVHITRKRNGEYTIDAKSTAVKRKLEAYMRIGESKLTFIELPKDGRP